MSKEYLVITIIGPDRRGLVAKITEEIVAKNANIEESHMARLGGEFAVIMMVSGSWDNVAKLENSLPSLSKKLDLTTTIKHTSQRTSSPALAYSVNVVALDNPGIVHEIAQYFSQQNINIDDLQTGTYSAPHTGTQMFNLTMTIRLAADTHIASLREEFMDFCDDLNLDAIIEPMRHA